MKKLLLALIMCAFASTMFAQWHRMPPRRPVYNNYGMVQQQRRVVMRQPRVYMRRQGMVRMNFGPVYYGGGWGVDVVFLRQPRVYIQQPRIVYARTPRCQAEAGILEYMINKGDGGINNHRFFIFKIKYILNIALYTQTKSTFSKRVRL